MKDYKLSMACVILHNGMHTDTWYNIEHYEIVNSLYLIKYRGKWYHFDGETYCIGYFWVTPDVLRKQEMEEEFINKKIDELYEKLFEEIKGIDGVVTSLTEKDGKLISSVEIDLTKYKFSKLKESNNYFFTGLVQSGFLTEDGDHASFSKSKEVALKRGMTEQTK